MNPEVEPLVNDEFAGEASKRTLHYLQSQREKGKNIVGTYCGYAPMEVIRAAGAVIVALDSCSGMKPYAGFIDENTADPYRAVARHYLDLPCSCMTPNTRRLTELDKIIARFKPDVVVDVVLHACHSYNIESHKIKERLKANHPLPFLKIETDYSQSDAGQIRTRVEALFEMLPKK